MAEENATDEQQDDESPWSDAKTKVLDSHIAQLMEHFDSVEIIVTKFDPQQARTGMRGRGDGNWYTRYGSIKEWVTREEEKTRFEVRPNRDGD